MPSGKVPSAIHVTPEAAVGGPLAKVRDGDLVRVDAIEGSLDVRVDASAWNGRTAETPATTDVFGWGRELFAPLRRELLAADEGAGLPRA